MAVETLDLLMYIRCLGWLRRWLADADWQPQVGLLDEAKATLVSRQELDVRPVQDGESIKFSTTIRISEGE
jgi:hypothetical protein